MTGVIILIVMALLFLIMSLFLLNGKGSWLIAGYNTASQNERDKYDEKKLCRAVGLLCLLCCVMMCVLAWLGYRVETGTMSEAEMLPYGLASAAVILAAAVAAVIYSNTKAKR